MSSGRNYANAISSALLKPRRIQQLVLFIIAIMLVIYLIIYDIPAEYYDELLSGFYLSMGLYLVGIFLGLGLGIIVAVIRHFGGPLTSRIATGYIEVLRGTPLIAQIILVVYGPPAINEWLAAMGWPQIDLYWQITYIDPWGTTRVLISARMLLCAITLGLNSAAYQAEYIRSSIASISSGQTLAAVSLGMTRMQEIRYIMLPQGLRRAIPAWSNEAVYLPQYTTVCFIVGLEEFFTMAKLVATRTYEVLPVYTVVAIVFLVLVSAISLLLNYIYNRIKIPGI
jgi:polar amino acid transport system permease protein